MEYPKIQSLFFRDQTAKLRPLIVGSWSCAEFEYLANNQWLWTEKVDGTNVRVHLSWGWAPACLQITIKGKNDRSEVPPQLRANLEECYNRRAPLFKDYLLGRDVTFFGEGYGHGIQSSGKFYAPEQKFVVFDIMVDGKWLSRPQLEELCAKLYLDCVPIIGQGTLMEAFELAQSGSLISTWTKDAPRQMIAEGIVASPLVPLYGSGNELIRAKIKYKDRVVNPDGRNSF